MIVWRGRWETSSQQGEGAARADVWDGDADLFHPGTRAVSHYYRFRELALGRRYQPGDTPASGPTGEPVTVDPAGIRPLRPNPRPEDHPEGSAVRNAREEFNRTYCKMLQQLEQAFNGKPAMLGMSVGTMYALKGQVQGLMALQDDDGLAAGPTFDYVAPEDRV